ncbi:hypothetical protein MRS76_24360 [Rhizobiaceae bacterium n13]|uniref:hypothetical protein n=1 Tax=Ferirhizobium litorale TaxID=2927786 RepID=UPI0024B2F5FE|nr:hypothetical protein [Fererhizobium litorale]MDI7865054.1 hypothetical protein [Fererhizobium litorale]
MAITQHEVDEIGGKIATLMEAERIAAFARDQARADYQDQVNAALSEPIINLTAEIAGKVNEVERLLQLAVTLNTEAKAAGVTLSSRFPGASGLIMTQGLFHLRAMLNRFPTTAGL